MITGIEGVRVGHWTDSTARTGCTVVLLPAGTVASGEVRGGAPGTREWALLAPEKTVDRIDAVVLAGGSAFGLAACDGVMRWCEGRGIGYPTAAGPVPIVVGMVIYDLMVGDPSVRPGANSGYEACVTATAGPVASGPVGAGTGATIGKWRGPEHVRPGGLGSARLVAGDLIVAALVVVNAIGDVRSAGLTTTLRDDEVGAAAGAAFRRPDPGELANTTIGVVVTNAAIGKSACLLVAQSSHDGLARALDPVHTSADGDALVAAATGSVPAPTDQVRMMAARAVEAAVRDAVERP